MRHRDITDIRGPDLVRPLDFPARQQVRVNRCLPCRSARARFAVECLDPHTAHEGGDMQPPDLKTLSSQLFGYAARAIVEVIQMQLIDPPHQLQILLRDRTRRVVHAAAIGPQQLTLPLHRQLCFPIDHLRPLGPGKRPSAVDKKSRSTVSSPIFACSSWTFSRSAVLSAAAPPNTSVARCSNSFFQPVIWVGCTSYWAASSAVVFSPFNASSATRALNAGEWFRRGLSHWICSSSSECTAVQSTYPRVRNCRATSLDSIERILSETITDPIGPEFMAPPLRSANATWEVKS